VTLAFRTCNDAEKQTETHYLSSTEERAQHYADVGCCVVDESTAIFKKGKPDQYTVTYRQWVCPVGTAQKRQVGLEGTEEINLPVQVDDIPLPWNLDRIDQRFLPRDNIYDPMVLPPLNAQKKVHGWVVDTGIDKNHAAFHNVEISMDYPSESGAVDCYGHGTGVASVIVSYSVGILDTGTGNVEDQCNIVLHSVRVLDCSGRGSTMSVINGLIYIQNNADDDSVINLSLGSPKSQILDDLVTSMKQDRGFAMIVAGGNDNVDACTQSPSGADGATAVGAMREDDNKASFSNWGICIKLFAPGNNIPVAAMGTVSDISLGSGTSYSSPAMAGSVLRCMIKKNLNPVQGIQCILAQTTKNALTGVGTGSPNALLYIDDLASPQPPTTPTPKQPNPPPPPPPPPRPPPNTNRSVRLEPYNSIVIHSYIIIGLGVIRLSFYE
jgi:hypothetical protein